MIPHVFRYAAMATLLTGAAVTATVTGHVPLLATDGPSTISLTDSNAVPLNSPGIIDRASCLTIGLVKETAYQCGDLITTYTLPSVRVNGKTQAPVLVFNSQTAHPHPLLTLDVSISGSTNFPDSVVYVTKVNGTARDSIVITSAMLASSHSRRRMQVGWDAYSDPTGVYSVVIDATSYYGGVKYTASTSSSEVIVVNRVNSTIGLGWALAGIDQLFFPADTTERLMVNGDGSARIFRKASSNVWVADAFDHPDTLTFGSTTFTHRLPGGANVVFNAQGQHVQTVDPRTFITTFRYRSSAASAPLDSITLPKLATSYRFHYLISGADTVLDSVRAPGTSGDRITHLNTYGPVLYQIFDPAGNDEYFEIAQSGVRTGRILLRRGKGGKVSLFRYDALGHLVVTADSMVMAADSPATPRADVTTICPFFKVDTIATSACGSVRFSEPPTALIKFDGPRPNSPTADVSSFRVHRFGAPEMIVGAVNDTTFITRGTNGCNNFPAFVTQTIASNGLTTNACSDNGGHVKQRVVVNAFGNSASQTTTYVWDARWDKVDSISNNLGQTTFIATYDSHGNVDSIADSRSNSATQFVYGSLRATISICC